MPDLAEPFKTVVFGAVVQGQRMTAVSPLQSINSDGIYRLQSELVAPQLSANLPTTFNWRPPGKVIDLA